MIINVDNILLVSSILLVLSVLFAKTSSRFGVPALLLFLGIGMIAGSDGRWNQFRQSEIGSVYRSVFVGFILFSEGSIPSGMMYNVSSGGNFIVVGRRSDYLYPLGFLFIWLPIFVPRRNFARGHCFIDRCGSRVFHPSLQRRRAERRLRPLLELESGSNDPMAYVLTLIFLFLITNPDKSAAHLAMLFVKQMVLGTVIGIAMGKVMQFIINRIKLDADGLYSVLLMALMLLTFSGTDYMDGNGFLAVYLAAFVLGNSDFIHKRSLTKHFDGWAWLMQIVLFITLGLQVFPSQLGPQIGAGLMISLFLILLARPISIFLVLWPFRFNLRSKLFISWVGLRGAVPIVFATTP
jgi:cell volume regulation protein A